MAEYTYTNSAKRRQCQQFRPEPRQRPQGQKWQSCAQTLPPATLRQPTPAMSARRTTPDSTSTRLFPTPFRRAIIGQLGNFCDTLRRQHHIHQTRRLHLHPGSVASAERRRVRGGGLRPRRKHADPHHGGRQCHRRRLGHGLPGPAATPDSDSIFRRHAELGDNRRHRSRSVTTSFLALYLQR